MPQVLHSSTGFPRLSTSVNVPETQEPPYELELDNSLVINQIRPISLPVWDEKNLRITIKTSKNLNPIKQYTIFFVDQWVPSRIFQADAKFISLNLIEAILPDDMVSYHFVSGGTLYDIYLVCDNHRSYNRKTLNVVAWNEMDEFESSASDSEFNHFCGL